MKPFHSVIVIVWIHSLIVMADDVATLCLQDNNADYENALMLYKKALDWFMTSLKYSREKGLELYI